MAVAAPQGLLDHVPGFRWLSNRPSRSAHSGTHSGSAGGADIISLDGSPGAFTVLGTATIGVAIRPRDGDILRATKVGSTLNMYLNGTRISTYTGPLVADGSGIGIAGFIRPGSTNNKFGFRRVSMGAL